jgi:hypothetical protein
MIVGQSPWSAVPNAVSVNVRSVVRCERNQRSGTCRRSYLLAKSDDMLRRFQRTARE